MKIIIVDDEINAFYNFLDKIISNNDIDYKFFYDKADAIIKYVKENKIDGAFLDINMPNISGLELAKKLIDINPKINIIFITGLTITYDDLADDIKNNTLGFMYKPYNEDELMKYLNLLNNHKKILKVKMFPNMNCYMNDKKIEFASLKSKELFALLLTYRGNSLYMDDAISKLWPDKDIDKAKISYRDAVWKLRYTLKEIDFECVIFKRGVMELKTNDIECDYWDFLDGKNKDYNYDFLNSYTWSIDYLMNLDAIKDKNKD